MPRFLLLFACWVGLLSASWPAEAAPGQLKVLFLGDQGHHQPRARFDQLEPVLRLRGIALEYTEDLAALRLDNLRRYDALLIYANIDQIEPPQEQALIDYVQTCGGFAPIHCASYCFLNSPRYIALVGAQFHKHGTGEFDTQVIDAKHPIMRGLAPFTTWDETYVHHQHNEAGRQVLQTRAEGDGQEPWTWVRQEGQGRVFYTAYGHDHRTWGAPGFQALVERGLRWAAGDDVFDSTQQANAGLPEFKYEEADVPFYDPHVGRNGADKWKQMQLPLSPTESHKHMVGPRDFTIELFAAEPQIGKPLAMAWDHRGRLWIAESVDYPNDIQPEGQGNDQIKICEDTDGDGRADKFTVFADKLSIPTSLTFANGGLVVHQAPDTLFLEDIDGDDRADKRSVLFTGWSTGDTHAGPSNLQWGPDNWIWGMVGYAGYDGEVGGEKHNFRMGFYRFKPDGSQMEFIRNTNNNSWGVGFSEEGLLFGSTANGNPSVYMPIANRYYESVRGWTSSVLSSIASDKRFFPITENVRQVDWHGQFTAAAGHALYTARQYPPAYWNRTAFVTEPTGHLAATFVLQPNGSDFTSVNAHNIVASDDEWTAPIMAEVGPDGNVWVIDWYNYIVQHNPTPAGFQNGKGNAYITPLRDKVHGRVYRVVYDRAEPAKAITLDPQNSAQLVAELSNTNRFWRIHAQRLLVERGQLDVLPALLKLIADPSVDAVGLSPGAMHALWTLHGLGALDGSQPTATAAAIAALKHPSAGVRRNALVVLPRDAASSAALMASGALQDDDAQVRLAALLALSEMPASPTAGEAIVAVLGEPRNLSDRWIPEAATSAAAAHDAAFLQAVMKLPVEGQPADRLMKVVAQVAEHQARGKSAEAIRSLVKALATGHPRLAEQVVTGWVQGWPADARVTLNEQDGAALKALVRRLPPNSRGKLVTLVGRWGGDFLGDAMAEISADLLAVVRDEKAEPATRISAAKELVLLRKADATIADELLALVSPRMSAEVATGLIEAVGQSEAAEAGPALVESLAASTPTVRVRTLQTLLGRPVWTGALLTHVEQQPTLLNELSLDQKQALASHPDKALAEQAKKLLARGGGLPDANRQKVIDELLPQVSTGGDAVAGAAVFKTQCAKCHRHSGEGGQVGPDLTGMAVHPRHELLIHLIDPSRSVEGNFRQYALLTDEGLVINGLLSGETKNAVEMIDAEGRKHTVLRENIDELIASPKSIMPEGFEQQVKAEGVRDLLAFLTQRGKFLPLDLAKAATIVSTQGMFHAKTSTIERLAFDDWSPKIVDGVPFQLVDPQGDQRANVILLYGPIGNIPPTMPKQVELACATTAKTIHFLSGVSGWGYPGGGDSVSMIVRLHYADGQAEDHPLKNGEHFADYIRVVDVPRSKLAFKFPGGQQIRYLTVTPNRKAPLARLELVKGPDSTAPIVMAITVEGE